MNQNSGFILDGVYILERSLQTQFKKEKDMDQNSGLFTVIAYFLRCSQIFDFILDGV